MDSKTYADTFVLDKGVLIDICSVFDNIKLSLYKFDIITIANDMNVWAFNRKLNQDHIDEMYNVFIQQKNPHMMGTIKVVRTKIDEIRVIDGQHRLSMVKKYIDEGHTSPVNVFVEVYHVDSLEHPVVFKLFKMANTNLNVSVEDDVNMHIVNLVNALANDKVLGKGIIDNNDGKVRHPRISKKHLYELLKDHIKAQDIRLSVEETVKRIKDINEQIGSKSNLELFRRKKPCSTKLNFKNTADKIHFYLNLPGGFCPEVWIKMISTHM